MKQVAFVKKNEDKWKKIEEFNKRRIQFDADELAKLYIDITDELSYVKTFYPDSNLVDYLNHLASQLHTRIYQNKKENRNRLITYWTEEIPLAIERRFKELKWSFIIFMGAVIIGLFSANQEIDFVRMILGDNYVNMTLENIKNEDPMAVYKGDSQAGMFIGIGSNNIRVSFLAFVAGIFASVFTGFILFSNGIMVGAFIYFFIQEGLFGLSFTTIMIHGTLELSAIVIAAAAGMILGNSWMFPGTFTRIQSLISGSKDAIKILISLIPIFLVAAFLESFVTRHYLSLGMTGRISIIGLSGFYLFWYFYLLPKEISNKIKISTPIKLKNVNMKSTFSELL
jgi:uncharacterized membrane protein SpoIIM required for sporulation